VSGSGDVLAGKVGKLGFLAREIPAEVPSLLP
jgi:NAD(P)H-hydrate repair Nnr-like enzyme with NAD(P)H-hydrate dehydratase domain